MDPSPHLPSRRYEGPERRSPVGTTWLWLVAALDELDFGLILLGPAGRVLHVNRAARIELADDHPLQCTGSDLHAREPRDSLRWRAALEGAQRGLRRMITLGEPGDDVVISIVPLAASNPEPGGATLVMLGRQRMAGDLAVESYARDHHLTTSETRVLLALCRGAPPMQIAIEHDVAISTVRTQIGAIRSKTGAASIRDLVRRVVSLPPLMSLLLGRAEGAAALAVG